MCSVLFKCVLSDSRQLPDWTGAKNRLESPNLHGLYEDFDIKSGNVGLVKNAKGGVLLQEKARELCRLLQ